MLLFRIQIAVKYFQNYFQLINIFPYSHIETCPCNVYACVQTHTHTHCSKKERLNVINLFTWRDIVSNSEGLVFAFWFLFVVAYFNYYNEKIIQHFLKIK